MNRKILKTFVIVLVFILSYGFIIYKIANFKELLTFDFRFFVNKPFNIFYLLIVLLFMILNWSLEAIKWSNLVLRIQKFSFIDSLKAVFAGITFGVFTPNRIGEIGGRIYFMDKGKRTYGALATGIGSYAQFITTITMGFFGFILFLILYPELIHTPELINKFTALLLILILVILIWSFYNIKKIKPFLVKFPFLKNKADQIDYLSHETTQSLSIVLIYSMLRYIVFFTQFFLLLRIFNVNIDFLTAMISISMTYLFMTLIPTTTLIELGIRGSLAIFFIGIFSTNTLGIIMATIFLWIINIALPAVVGLVFLFKKDSVL